MQGNGKLHAAKVDSSKRLQRVLDVLQDGKEHSTADLILRAHVCAVNSIVSELRANGYTIDCRSETVDGSRAWLYQLS